MNLCTYDMISTFYLKSLSPQKRGVKSENSTITERNTKILFVAFPNISQEIFYWFSKTS